MSWSKQASVFTVPQPESLQHTSLINYNIYNFHLMSSLEDPYFSYKLMVECIVPCLLRA